MNWNGLPGADDFPLLGANAHAKDQSATALNAGCRCHCRNRGTDTHPALTIVSGGTLFHSVANP
jgi:hypothetical protein